MSINIAAAEMMQNLNLSQDFTRFADKMDQFGYDWEAVPVKTEDGFTLTTFHILGKKGKKETQKLEKPALLIQHGYVSDAAHWLGDYDGVPMQLQLVDAGFDVWMGNNRGSPYCLQNDKFTTDDKEFWEWGFAEMGLYDDVANIKEIQKQTGVEKVTYIGYSQGTIQMLYALAHLEEEFFADNLNQFIALAPCTLSGSSDRSTYENSTFIYSDYGIYAYKTDWSDGGSAFNKDCQTVCDNLDADACNAFCGQEGNESTSIHDDIHWAQNAIEGRFQEYSPDYLKGKTKTKLIDIASIDKVPIAIWSGTADVTCPYDLAVQTAHTIGDAVKYFHSIDGFDHGGIGKMNDASNMADLIHALHHPVPKQTTFLQ